MTKLKPDTLSGGDDPTLRPERVPVVLVAGGPDDLLTAAQQVARNESPAIVVEACSALEVASSASSLRPFALVMSQDVYAFDSDEFMALARDTGAELVVIKVAASGARAFLEQALRPSLRAAFRRFRTETESGPVKR
jgi:hypothetical protein